MYWGLEGATYTNQPTREHGIEAHLERVRSHSGAPSTRSLPRTHPALHRRRDNFGGAHGRQLHVHCLRPSPILPSMAPATCIVRSSVNVRTPMPRPAVALRQDKGEHGRAPIGPIKRMCVLRPMLCERRDARSQSVHRASAVPHHTSPATSRHERLLRGRRCIGRDRGSA